MRDGNIVVGALIILGIAVLGAYWWSGRQPDPASLPPVAAHSTDGPVMEITVAGEANGVIRVQLYPDIAPAHVERLVSLAESGAYDGIVFHRVIDGFMAQTGDVQFGQAGGDTSGAGRGASDLPDLKAEFSDIQFQRGTVGMARSANEDSANSQFFIMFAPAPHLNGQYTVVGQVIDGLEVLDAIKRGTGGNGAVSGTPDQMISVKIVK